MKKFLILAVMFLIVFGYVSNPGFAMQPMTYDDGAPVRGPIWNRVPSDSSIPVVLTASAAQQITIPTGASKVIFSGTGGIDFWVKFDVASFTIPSATATTPIAYLMLNPLSVVTSGHTSICLLSASNVTVNMEFYQ